MKKIGLCKFDPTRHGQFMSVDIQDVDSFRNFLWDTPVYSTDYYSIYLITKGDEQLEVDGKVTHINPGMIVCSRPGELWSWETDTRQDGVYLYWTEDFIESFFKDPHFIETFPFFQIGRSSSFLYPDAKMFRRLLSLFSQMREEIEFGKANDIQHILRAMVYETLMLLQRVNSIPPEKDSDYNRASYYVAEFQKLAKAHYLREHNVEYYAGRLFITSNYLNKVVRQTLGISTKQYLSNLLYEEAKRLLKYTTLSINEISDILGLEPAYFIKKFKQRNSCTPLYFRTHLDPGNNL